MPQKTRIHFPIYTEKLSGKESEFNWIPIQLYLDMHPELQDIFIQCRLDTKTYHTKEYGLRI